MTMLLRCTRSWAGPTWFASSRPGTAPGNLRVAAGLNDIDVIDGCNGVNWPQ